MQIEGAKRTAKRTIIILSLALAGCRGPVAPASPTPDVVSIRLLADTATSPLLHELASAYHPAHDLIVWDIEAREPNALFDLLRASKVVYALTAYQPPEQSGSTTSTPLWSTPIGQTGIAFIVHPSNAISGLTAAQLRAILQGRIANWQALGGGDLPLTVIAQSENSSSGAIVQTIVMGDRVTTGTARLALTDDAVVSLVSTTPGAIGYVSVGALNDSVRAVAVEGVLPTPETLTTNQYPIRSPLLFVGLAEPGDDAYRAFFAWVQSPDGQAIVHRHYGTLQSQQ